MSRAHPFLRDAAPVLAFAHRGGAEHPDLVGLENTERAFAHAVALGYRYLETDVHLTRDGVLVAFHDAVLERVSDGTGAIADLTWADLDGVRIGGTEPVPTLAGLLEAFPDARFNLDLKAEAAVEPLVRELDRHAAWDRVLVGSFSPGRMRRYRGLAGPRAATSASPDEVAAFLALPHRLAGRLAPRPVALQVPHRQRGLLVTSPALVRRAHAAGVQVHVWTIDDPEEMHALLDRGVDGLMTDRTDILRAVLTERGLWRDEP